MRSFYKLCFYLGNDYMYNAPPLDLPAKLLGQFINIFSKLLHLHNVGVLLLN